MSNSETTTMLRVKLVRSLNGRLANHKASAKGLGLRKIGSEVVVPSTPENVGMIRTIDYLVEVTEDVSA